MADTDDNTPSLAEEVEANLAIEQGLGVGARELAAQHEAGETAIDNDEGAENIESADGRAQIKDV